MTHSTQEREKRTYDILSGNRGQRQGSYQRYLRGPVPVAKKEVTVEEVPKRHWAELLSTIEVSERMAGIYNIDCEPKPEPTPTVAEATEVQWSVPTQFKAPNNVPEGKKIDMNTIVMHSMTSMAPPNQAEPMPANGNALSQDLPMLQLQMLALRPR